jgi:hypothetical protein
VGGPQHAQQQTGHLSVAFKAAAVNSALQLGRVTYHYWFANPTSSDERIPTTVPQYLYHERKEEKNADRLNTTGMD